MEFFLKVQSSPSDQDGIIGTQFILLPETAKKVNKIYEIIFWRHWTLHNER